MPAPSHIKSETSPANINIPLFIILLNSDSRGHMDIDFDMDSDMDFDTNIDMGFDTDVDMDMEMADEHVVLAGVSSCALCNVPVHDWKPERRLKHFNRCWEVRGTRFTPYTARPRDAPRPGPSRSQAVFSHEFSGIPDNSTSPKASIPSAGPATWDRCCAFCAKDLTSYDAVDAFSHRVVCFNSRCSCPICDQELGIRPEDLQSSMLHIKNCQDGSYPNVEDFGDIEDLIARWSCRKAVILSVTGRWTLSGKAEKLKNECIDKATEYRNSLSEFLRAPSPLREMTTLDG